MVIKSGRRLWSRHPAVRTERDLTIGERAADAMRSGFGSWTFVFVFLALLAGWMWMNSFLLPRNGTRSFDPFPYILLNLVLSCLAALQGALILIAAKRADRVAAEQATHHYGETAKIDQLLEQNTDLTRKVHELVSQLAALRAGLGPGAETRGE